MGFWSGEKARLKKFETLNKYQKQMHNQMTRNPALQMMDIQQNPLYQQGGGFLSSILSQDPRMMQQFEAPYMSQFNEEIVPQLAERFSGMGARNSSAFQQAMGQAGSGLAERLASMRANLGMGAAQQALGYAQQPFQNAYMGSSLALGTSPWGYQSFQGQPGAAHGIFQGAGQGFGQGAGAGLFDWAKKLF